MEENTKLLAQNGNVARHGWVPCRRNHSRGSRLRAGGLMKIIAAFNLKEDRMQVEIQKIMEVGDVRDVGSSALGIGPHPSRDSPDRYGDH